MKLSEHIHSLHWVFYKGRPRRLKKEVAKLEESASWSKRSAKAKRLKSTVMHYLLALDTDDKEKLAIEEERLRRYSGYGGWPKRHKPQ